MPGRFALFVPDSMLTAYGCEPHHRPSVDRAHCRGCSITYEIDCIQLFTTDLDLAIIDGLHPEFGVLGRSFHGTYRSEDARRVVTRMIAWLQGHPEPESQFVKAPSSMSPGVDTPGGDR